MHFLRTQPKGFVIWTICALFFLYEFFLRIVIGTYQVQVMHDLQLNSFEFSILSTTVFLLIYGIMQIPAGMVIEQLGLKKSLLLAILCCVVSAFGFSEAHTFASAIVYRFLMGFGASFGFICLLVSIHEWMPKTHTALIIGLSQFIGTLGPMFATGPLESLSQHSSVTWRTIFQVLGLVGVIIFVLAFLFVQNKQRQAGTYTILHPPENTFKSLKRMFQNPQPWFIAIISASLYFTVEYLSENEGRAFLALKGFSIDQAGYLLTLSWVGYAIGCPFFGFMSDYLQRRKVIFKLCGTLALIAIISIIFASHPILLACAFFTLGISAGGQTVGFASIAEHFKKRFIAVGFGFNNMFITTLSAINAPVIGLLLDYNRGQQALALFHYYRVFTILILIACIATLLAFFAIKETYCKSCVELTHLTPQSKSQP